MEFPYEGDLLAVVEGVTIPRLAEDALAKACTLIGVPDIRPTITAIADGAWWTMRMGQR